jgi:CDP-glucose 4,6-dehydratase
LGNWPGPLEKLVKNHMNYQHLTHYYKGKRVFLTGHTGFKGSWMLYWLHLLGAEVKGYALAPENEFDLFNVIDGNSLCESVIGDIRDTEKLSKEILSFEPHFIFHLAAQPLVRLSYEIPSDTFAINAIGTAHVLDAVRLLRNPCNVILITTDKVYENKEWPYAYRENDRLGGYDPYSASKACAELIISSYRNSFFHVDQYSSHKKSIASARAGNVIGGGDWSKDRIVPDIVRALSKDLPVKVRNPSAVRPWQHVLEPIGGYLHLGAKLQQDPVKYSESWNFGPLPEDNLTVEELVITAVNSWGSGQYEKPPTDTDLHEAALLRLDVSKTILTLGWKPKFNSYTAVQKTMDWYKSKLRSDEDKTRSQIESYFNHLD